MIATIAAQTNLLVLNATIEAARADTGSASSQVLASAQLLSSENKCLKAEVVKFLATERAA